MTIFDRTAGFEVDVASARDTVERFTTHRDLAGLRVLDVGCRNGDIVRALTDLGADAWGVDLSAVCVAHARRRFPELADRFEVRDLRTLRDLPASGFDLVLCIGVLPYTAAADWLPALAAMASRCAPGGELRVLLQQPRPRTVQRGVDALSRLPESLYARAVAPVLTAAAWPVSGRLLGGRVPLTELHYRVSLSLYGLTFGYPPELEPYRYAVEPCRFISPRMSAAFAIPAEAALTLPGTAGRRPWRHRPAAS